MLLHGWMASADLNWSGAYDALTAAGYRVLAIDHRGHGRGLRSVEPFTLADCAADAAGVLHELRVAPSIVVGYSMGGTIAQLMARDHPDVVLGLVLSATKREFQHPREKRTWRAMGVLRLLLAIAPYRVWNRGLRYVGLKETPATAWLVAELLRASPRDVAEAGRELGRFDSRPWIGSIRAPAAVVVTTRDRTVIPPRQLELAEALGASVFEAAIDHVNVVADRHIYNPALLRALEAVRGRDQAKAA
jgi:3-oxoadipate enol-lactonase